MSRGEQTVPDPSEAIFNGQRKPDEWDDLVTQFVDLDQPVPDVASRMAAAKQMIALANLLPNEQLDVNRNYGFGQIICGMAQIIYQPAARQELVGQEASRIEGSHAHYVIKANLTNDPGRLLLGEVQANEHEYYDVLLAKATQSLPKGVQKLTDTLDIISRYRLLRTKKGRKGAH